MNDQTNRSRLYEKYSISHNIIEGRVFIKRKLTDFFPNGVNRGVRQLAGRSTFCGPFRNSLLFQ